MITEFKGEYRWLSNYYPCRIDYEGISYPTVEHAYQACKTNSFDEKRRIASFSRPGDAKRLGRVVDMREDWEDIKYDVMYELLKIKFSQPDLRRSLVETGEQHLEEGNYWHDNYWGNCYCPRCEQIEGQNNLGKLLMDIRSELRERKDG